MKKITFKVAPKKDASIASVIKGVNTISCRINLDLENGLVTVEDVCENLIDTVIDFINDYYSILSIDIDNTEETKTHNQADITTEISKKETVENLPKSSDNAPIENVSIKSNQHNEDLFIAEVKSKIIRNFLNSFLKTISWALSNCQASEKDICDYILTTASTLSLRYSSKTLIDFSVGDIVDVNFGSQLPGEVMGGHVHAIICNILSDDMAYVLPITKATTSISSKNYMFMKSPKDVTYSNNSFEGGTVLVDKGRYIRAERFRFVVGKTTPVFFEKLLASLANAFDFTQINTSCLCQDTFNSESTVVEVFETTKESKAFISKEETELCNIFGDALEKLNSTIPVEEQIPTFLADIGMSTSSQLIIHTFVVASYTKKISYNNILSQLSSENSEINEESIKTSLKKVFKDWLKNYPELAEKCPKISFMSLLKVFKKKIDA